MLPNRLEQSKNTEYAPKFLLIKPVSLGKTPFEKNLNPTNDDAAYAEAVRMGNGSIYAYVGVADGVGGSKGKTKEAKGNFAETVLRSLILQDQRANRDRNSALGLIDSYINFLKTRYDRFKADEFNGPETTLSLVRVIKHNGYKVEVVKSGDSPVLIYNAEDNTLRRLIPVEEVCFYDKNSKPLNVDNDWDEMIRVQANLDNHNFRADNPTINTRKKSNEITNSIQNKGLVTVSNFTSLHTSILPEDFTGVIFALTDGVTDNLPFDEIKSIIEKAISENKIDEINHRLVNAARAAGKKNDDITSACIVIGDLEKPTVAKRIKEIAKNLFRRS